MADNKSVSLKGAARAARADERRAIEAVTDEAKNLQEAAAARSAAVDSFLNLAQNMGIGGDNPLTTATYGFNPVTRQRITLEWMHRGSWLAGLAVDLPAEDMTREGVTILGDTPPEKMEEIEEEAETLGVWGSLCDGVAWGRLYGGAIAVHQIEGQDMSTPLRLEAIGKEQYKGLMVFDRWMADPDMGRMIKSMGPDRGLPEFYTIRSDANAMRGERIHHSRVIRFIGNRLPYWQTIIEMMWGTSVLERLFDRMTAFDSASTGAAQLVYRAWVRNLKLKNLRQMVSGGQAGLKGVVAQLHFMRRYANSEGFTVIDAEDEMEVLATPAFSGLSDIMLSFGEQLAGALQTPLVRLFGQSPKGLNATGESDLRIYADNVRKNQNRQLKPGVTTIYKCIAMSKGIRPKDGFGVQFNPLYQLSDKEKGEVAKNRAEAVSIAWNDGVISPQTYLKELKQGAPTTGIFSNITAKEIADAEDAPPPTAPGLAGEEGAAPEGGEDKGDKKGEKKPAAKKPASKKAATGDSFEVVAELQRAHGLEIVIESKKGEIRRGKDWQVFMAADYGYIRNTVAPDGQQVDCYVGDQKQFDRVWIIDQLKLDGAPDEPKVMLGYPTLQEAMRDYLSGFTDGLGWQRVGGTRTLTMPAFKTWLSSRRPS